MKTIKIEMIHDLVCSWCPIGYNHLKVALERIEDDVTADIQFLPFQLNPEMPPEGELIADYFKERMGWDADQLKKYQTSLIRTGTAAGVSYDFSKRTHYYNTFKGHCLIHWAEKFGQHRALNELMIDAYFTKGSNLSNEVVLLDLVEQLGLNRSDALQSLTDPVLLKEISKKQQRVATLNVTSIPAFLINDEYIVSGSNSPDFFEEVLMRFSLPERKKVSGL
jgi:predicted DsbA family dithiol-disulfide isomerase